MPLSQVWQIPIYVKNLQKIEGSLCVSWKSQSKLCRTHWQMSLGFRERITYKMQMEVIKLKLEQVEEKPKKTKSSDQKKLYFLIPMKILRFGDQRRARN